MASVKRPPAAAARSKPDAARRERWARALLDGRFDEINGAFAQDNTEPPTVVWNPEHKQLQSKVLWFLLDHWNGLRGAAAAPPMAALDPVDLRQALGYVLLIDPLDDGADFRYRLYGSLIATVSGADLTGKRVSEHHASGHVVDFSLAGYRAAYLRAEPLYTLRHPARAVHTRSWERLVLPLLAKDGRVGRFLVGNVPTDHLGGTIRPQF